MVFVNAEHFFSPNFTVSNLATCFASERYLRASGTFTLWDILVKELYLPFGAHTQALAKMAGNVILKFFYI